MSKVVESIEYKGYIINVKEDEFSQNPNEWADENWFLVGFHRDFTVEREGFGVDVCRALVSKDEYKAADESIKERVRKIKKQYHFFGLEAYIHSGVVLALSHEGNFPDRKWDVSQLGCVFIAKAEAKTRKKAKQSAASLIESWNDYLGGNVYGYEIESKDGEQIDSCWDFYGDYRDNGMLNEAKKVVDDHLEAIRKQVENKKYKDAKIQNEMLENNKTTLLKCVSMNPIHYRAIKLTDAISRYSDYLKSCEIGKGKSFEDWLLTEI